MESLSRTAKYYRKNKKARAKKAAYDKEYNKRPEQVKKRVELNRERRRRKLKGNPKDLSHTKNGSLVLESKRKNRGRQGANGQSTLKG